MEKYNLGNIATVEISGVDKKIKDGEKEVRLCNFVDVYYNWAITTAQYNGFMLATARPNEISKFQLKKGQVALTKDSETRDDIGIPTYIADNFEDVILAYHCALITPNKDLLDGRYLNALLHTDYAKKYFACNASGSGQRYALSVEALSSFPVPMIPLREQERIGEIFSAIDKKIELNHRINQNFCPSELENAIDGWVKYYNERRFHESLDNLTPRDVYLGQGEKIKKTREIIKQNSINKRSSENKRMKLQRK